MAKTRKPETAAPPRKGRANRSAPVAAQGGPTAAFPRHVTSRVPQSVSRSAPVRRESAPATRTSFRPSPVPSPAVPVGAVVSRRAADHLRSGHLWVYASDVIGVSLPKAEETLLPVADQRGIFLGTALYSPASQIALRLVSREALDHSAWLEVLAARLRAAISRRRSMLDAANDACRLCFSEADELPGLIVDKYGEIVVVQRLTKGLLAAGVIETCLRVLREELAPAAIFERPDPRIRELEGLPAPSADPLWVAEQKSTADRVSIATVARSVAAAQFHLNGLVFEHDANSGQKTGAFLDQRNNYSAAQQWAQRLGVNGRALDVCCYQGGFALHLAQVCRQVTGIDSSRASLEVAERNLQANRTSLAADVDWIEADAFEILRDWSQAGEKFDAIILDPPAFAKTKRAVEGALRGYKELNLRALKMLRPRGLLVTCSCSHHVSWADLESAVAAAAADASRRVRLLERRGAAPDHPVILNLPETEYLKCLMLEVE
jgi:23S rRNA (cytosine1962-C5)-methyltransferase